MTDRYEARCSRCGLIAVVTSSDAPGPMTAETYAEFESQGHAADCQGAVDIHETVDVVAETTKYSVEGDLRTDGGEPGSTNRDTVYNADYLVDEAELFAVYSLFYDATAAAAAGDTAEFAVKVADARDKLEDVHQAGRFVEGANE